VTVLGFRSSFKDWAAEEIEFANEVSDIMRRRTISVDYRVRAQRFLDRVIANVKRINELTDLPLLVRHLAVLGSFHMHPRRRDIR
jgi:hypothetical protein